MRVLLAISLIAFTQAAKRAINLPCNKELDGLLAMDPEGNPSAFLSCQGVGVGNIGFWERKVCPDNMIFDFINQQCKSSVVRKQHRKQQTGLNIAILNNSCAKGETCIGGTVCDLDTLRCLCPYGTIPQLDTLSCIKSENLFNPERFQFSFENNNQGSGNFHPNMNQQTISNNNNNGGFVPNPNFNKFPSTNNQFVGNSNNNNNNNNFNNNFGNNQWPAPPSPSASSFNSFGGSGDMQPNPNQKFVFGNFMASSTVAPTTKKIPLLAEPGKSCRSNEICIGGSICTLPIGLCLCPGDLEAREGECVLPPTSSITIQKVGIGAICNDLAECDNGSSCQMGRCACVAPLIQFEGKCVLRQERKEVGPGELCDNGEICIKGSVCDNIIPVCVCPPETDLSNGECIHVQKGNVQTAPPTYQYTPPPTLSPQTTNYIPPTTPQPTYIPIQPQQLVTFTQAPTSKPNHMKIALGGSKQAGVGVRCSLNTDCMIGAYCNGNTNPPSCQCLSTHVNVEGRCEKVIYPGQVGCRSDMQCSAAYAGTTCVDRLCKCPEGTKTVDQTCIPANEPVTSPPGGSCTDARECTGGSVCREGWCICPDPSMIVQKGICIQSGIRPTLPPKTVQTYTTAPPPTTRPTVPPTVATYRPTQNVNTFNALPSPTTQGRKVVPGSQCGPLDTCVGGSMCLDAMCVCPAGSEAKSTGRCEAITTTTQTSTQPTTRAATNANIAYSAPGEYCGDGHVCSGGSSCGEDKTCACPTEKPMIKYGECHAVQPKRQGVAGESCDENTECINGSNCHSGQCRCAPQFVALSGFCVNMPMSTTPQMKTFAKPLENCENGEICEGGSNCDYDTGICLCPAGQVAFGPECRVPPTAASNIPSNVAMNPATTDCENDDNCGDGKLCVAGRCRCKPGTVDNAGICELLEEIEIGDRPIPISYARHRVLTEKQKNSSSRETIQSSPSATESTASNRDTSEETTEVKDTVVETTVATTTTTTTDPPSATAPSINRAPSRAETQKPRIVGPPIRRPKPKSKGSSGSGNGGSPASYKTGGSGNGNCPPGNEATRDSSGKLILCNGLEPNCPPRSYCYITSGGFATEEYNCCKSW